LRERLRAWGREVSPGARGGRCESVGQGTRGRIKDVVSERTPDDRLSLASEGFCPDCGREMMRVSPTVWPGATGYCQECDTFVRFEGSAAFPIMVWWGGAD